MPIHKKCNKIVKAEIPIAGMDAPCILFYAVSYIYFQYVFGLYIWPVVDGQIRVSPFAIKPSANPSIPKEWLVWADLSRIRTKEID